MVMSKDKISKLNDMAKMWDMQPIDALHQVCNEADLYMVASDGNVELWADETGEMVNLWLEGPQSMELEDGGAGFDDQIEWYTEA